MKRSFLLTILGPVLAAFFVLTAVTGPVFGAPKSPPSVKPGNCAACHKDKKVLSPDHKETTDMTYKDCLSCHEKSGPLSLKGKMPSSHTHHFAAVTCVKCHGTAKKKEEVAMKRCVTCHNTDGLAEKTAKVKPANPHESPHYGRTLDCNLCHHQHKKSENYCLQCHKFDFVVP